MQVIFGMNEISALSKFAESGSGASLLPSGGNFGDLLGSVQLSLQTSTAAGHQTVGNSVDFSTLLASLAGNSSLIEEMTGKEKEIAETLLEKGEIPSMQELAVLLQVDMETLEGAFKKVISLLSEEQVNTGASDASETSGSDLTAQQQLSLLGSNTDSEQQNGNQKENTDMPAAIDQLAAVIQMIADQAKTTQPIKAADKQAFLLTVKTAQLINQFAANAQEKYPEAETKFQNLQLALKMAAQSADQQTVPRMQGEAKQLILQMAFNQYTSSQTSEESGTPNTAKTTVQPNDSYYPFLHQLSKIEQFAMSIKTNPRPMNMEQFIEKFTQLLGNSNMMKTPNGTKMLIKLYPEQLGSLRIELLQQNGVMTAKILSSTQAVKELLEQNAHQLKNAFNQQNITVDKIDVSSADTRQQLYDKGAQQQQRQQEQRQSDEQQTGQNPDEQQTLFEEALLHAELEV